MNFRKEYFENFMLKASMYGEFNDPFDLVLGSYGASLSEEDRSVFYDAMPEYMSGPIYYDESYLDIQAGARASLSIMCFTKNFKNILMWSHYANNHTGVCIGYDYSCSFFHNKYSCSYSDNVGEIRRIEYTNDRPKFIVPSDLVNDTSEWFKKSKDWKYDKEYRVLLSTDDAIYNYGSDPAMLFFKIHPKYIKRVILGCRMEEKYKKYKKYIYNMLAYYNIEIMESQPDPAHYKLNFKKYILNNSSKPNVIYNLGMDI